MWIYFKGGSSDDAGLWVEDLMKNDASGSHKIIINFKYRF